MLQTKFHWPQTILHASSHQRSNFARATACIRALRSINSRKLATRVRSRSRRTIRVIAAPLLPETSVERQELVVLERAVKMRREITLGRRTGRQIPILSRNDQSGAGLNDIDAHPLLAECLLVLTEDRITVQHKTVLQRNLMHGDTLLHQQFEGFGGGEEHVLVSGNDHCVRERRPIVLQEVLV